MRTAIRIEAVAGKGLVEEAAGWWFPPAERRWTTTRYDSCASAISAEPDLLVDTSVAVAVVVADHPAIGPLDAVGARTLGMAGHAWFESYSVLTRLRPPWASRWTPCTTPSWMRRPTSQTVRSATVWLRLPPCC